MLRILFKLNGVTEWDVNRKTNRISVALFVTLANLKKRKKTLPNANKLKRTGIYIYQDFSKDTMEFRKIFWNKILEYCRHNKPA